MERTNAGYLSTYLIGIGFGIVFVCILFYFLRKDHKLKGNYDERQELIRGKGYKYAFFTVLIYMSVIFVADMSGFNISKLYQTLMFGGILLGIIVYADYAIINDAYFSLNDKYNRYIAVFSVLAFVNIAGGIVCIADGIDKHLPVEEMNFTNLMAGIMLLEILIVLAIKKIRDDRENKEE